jgi:hypothetical protein
MDDHNKRIDTDELVMQLREQGIVFESHLTEGRVLVSLTNSKDNTPIAIAVTESVEKSLSVIMRRLTDDSKQLKETVNPDKGLLSDL